MLQIVLIDQPTYAWYSHVKGLGHMCKLLLPWIIGVYEILMYGLESWVDPRERKGNQASMQVFINYSTTSDSSMFCAPSKFLILHKEKLEGWAPGLDNLI